LAEDLESEQLNIPSIRLSKKLLEELCNVLQKEYHRDDEDSRNARKVKFEFIRQSGSAITKSDFDSFLSLDIPRDIRKVTLQLSLIERGVYIEIDMDNFQTSVMVVQGIETVWVNGVTRLLEKVFANHHTTKSDIFHANWKRQGIPLYIAITVSLQLGVYLSFLRNADEFFWLFNAIVYLGVPIIGAYGWHFFFQWLFPKVELENMMRVRTRRFIVATIPVVVLGLITNSISNASWNPLTSILG